ncbi:hypothetical protein ACP275_10G070500 [Erythranthe tilingii]
METVVQPRPIKLTIKLNKDKNAADSSTTPDYPNNVEESENASNSQEDQTNPIAENSQYQMVLYDPAVNSGAHSTEIVPRKHPFSDNTPRVLPSIGAFTVQCANCFKWRLIPTKEKYEEIREHIMERPFSCETAREWRPYISCDDPPDLTQDGTRVWAIDKPSIAQAPPGWQRLLRIRGEGGSKFADVYYVAPSGKRLRSMLEIQRYLNEHPEYMVEGLSFSQFSFQVPKPLQENYVRKRPRPPPQNDAVNTEVKPIAWISDNDVDTDLQLSGPRLSAEYSEHPYPATQATKKKKMTSSSSVGVKW